MGKTKPAHPAKDILGKLRSTEPPATIAQAYRFRESEVLAARELVRHIGEHQAPIASRLPELMVQAVVEAAIQIEHAPFLKALAEQGIKTAANAAKRGLSILRSRGIEVEIHSPKANLPLPFPTTAEIPCFITTSDSDGEHALWMARELPYGGLQATVVLFSDITGILHVESDEMGRKSFRELIRRLMQEASLHDVLLRRISISRAKSYLSAARLLSSHGLSLDIEAQILSLLGDYSQEMTPLKHMPVKHQESISRQLVNKSDLLHLENEIKPWIPDNRELVQSLRSHLEQISHSSLLVNETQRREYALNFLQQQAQAFFDREARQRYARRLFDLAEAFHELSRTSASELAQVTALALEEDWGLSAIPFCGRLFEKLLDMN